MSLAVLAAAHLTKLAADLAVVMPLVAMGVFGFRHGLFVATIAGLQVLAASVGAIAFAPPLAAWLEAAECPAAWSLVAAYVALFAGTLLATRLAVGAVVREDDVRFAPFIDWVGGSCLGAGAGFVLGGAILVGWSMAPLPESLRLEPDTVKLDAGSRLLRTFARCLLADTDSRRLLVAGERPGAGAAAGEATRASEPFVDDDGDGLRGDGERYLDDDGDGGFTRVLAIAEEPLGAAGRRDVGLADRYRLAEWRRVAVLHPPLITSGSTAQVAEGAAVETIVYQAAARDADTGDTPTFSLASGRDDDAGAVAIDEAAGGVTLLEPADHERQKKYVFTVVATDRAGLTAERRVTVTVKDVRDDAAP
jgi:hypothetical protein